MSLFHINRYLGDDVENGPDSESRAKVLLAQLQKKAKEREKRGSKCQTAQTPAQKRKAEEDGNEEPKLPKKRKGGVTPTAPLSSSDAVDHQEVAEEENKNNNKKKEKGAKKKQKKNDQSGVTQTVPLSASDVVEVKKKKRIAKKKQKRSGQSGVTPTVPLSASDAVEVKKKKRIAKKKQKRSGQSGVTQTVPLSASGAVEVKKRIAKKKQKRSGQSGVTPTAPLSASDAVEMKKRIAKKKQKRSGQSGVTQTVPLSASDVVEVKKKKRIAKKKQKRSGQSGVTPTVPLSASDAVEVKKKKRIAKKKQKRSGQSGVTQTVPLSASGAVEVKKRIAKKKQKRSGQSGVTPTAPLSASDAVEMKKKKKKRIAKKKQKRSGQSGVTPTVPLSASDAVEVKKKRIAKKKQKRSGQSGVTPTVPLNASDAVEMKRKKRIAKKKQTRSGQSGVTQTVPLSASDAVEVKKKKRIAKKKQKRSGQSGVTQTVPLSASDAVDVKKRRIAKKKQKRSGQSGVTPTVPLSASNTVEVKKKRKKRIAKKKQKSNDHSGGTPTVPLSASDAVDHEKVAEEEKNKTKKKKGAKKKQEKNDQSANSCPDPEGGEENKGGELEAEIQGDQSKQHAEKTPGQTFFKSLGGFEKKPLQKVHRVLPQWLAQPNAFHSDITTNLVPISESQGISARLMKRLESNGIQQLFPVQAEVIPAILESVRHGLLIGRGGYKPRDICVSAPTGSGKTLAFVIPVIQALTERVVREVRALAVLPTKELAQQVCKVFSSYAEGTTLKVVMLTGQKSFAAEQASLSENRGGMRRSLADIVVATPGRLVDHINKSPVLCLEHLRFLIIDEADRMIDSMHQSWLGQVTKAVYRSGSDANVLSVFKRTEPTHITAASLSPPQMPLQKLLFSATLTQNPEKLQQLGLYQPRLFSSVHSHPTSSSGRPSAPGTTSQTHEGFNFPQGLTEYYVPCTLSKKPLLILHFILRMKFSPILCFTNSRESAHRLNLLVDLFGGVQTAEFSSRLSPGQRKKTLKDFEKGNIQLLISTDAAARGIDINGVKCVVNYDAPQYIRTYIHRVGRTARAGKAGLAFTFLLEVQEKNFLQMVADAGSPGIQKQLVKPECLKSMEARYEQTLQELANAIKNEKAMR